MPKRPKKVFRSWGPPGFLETTSAGSTSAESRTGTTKQFSGLLHESEDRTCMVGGADDEKLTREAQLKSCEADVRKPLASAVRVAKAINNIWLEANGGYIVNRGR